MRPIEPPAAKLGFLVPEGSVGINLSPLVARFRKNCGQRGGIAEWQKFSAELVKSATNKLKRPILLIPHVGAVESGNDDFSFLESVRQTVIKEVRVPVHILPNTLGAAELKWVIGKCCLFAGARTHATIAALSCRVPTLSIGYSLKARGINRDIFGHLDYCIPVSDLTTTTFVERLEAMLEKQEVIRSGLASCIPEVQSKAFSAGLILRQILSSRAACNA